jgi:hypothetical protein
MEEAAGRVNSREFRATNNYEAELMRPRQRSGGALFFYLAVDDSA